MARALWTSLVAAVLGVGLGAAATVGQVPTPRIRRMLVFLTGVVLLPCMALGHGVLDRTDPRAGGQIKAAPPQIKLWFTGALEQAYSRVEVLDAAGKRMDLGDSAVDGANRALLRVSVPALPPGTYRVVWRVVSVDSHVTEGQFSFTVVR
jgi:copper resistance protein C